MPKRSYLAIINPAAGGGKCGRQAQAAIDALASAGIEVVARQTSWPGEATVFAEQGVRDGFRHFIAVGGDGTSYEVVNGLYPWTQGGEPPTLGFLPLGTGNSFLRDFTTEGASHAQAAIAADRGRLCDVLRLRHRGGVLHYINLLSIGFVADVNGRRARRYSGWGEAGYVAAVVREVAALRARPFPMAADGGAYDRDPIVFASFNNSRFTGGKMMMAPDADTSDGLIDVIRVAPLSRLDLLRTFPKIFKGTHTRNAAVSTSKVREIAFELDAPIEVMVDGEALEVLPEHLDVLPGALRVHV